MQSVYLQVVREARPALTTNYKYKYEYGYKYKYKYKVFIYRWCWWRGPRSQLTTRRPTNLYKYPRNRTELCLALSTNRCFSVQFTYLTIATTALLVNVDTCRVHYILQQEVKSPFDGLSNLQPHHYMGSKLPLQVSIELRYQAMRPKLRRQVS